MKNLFKILFFLVITFNIQAIYSQNQTTNTEELSLEKGTINDQFEYVLQKSRNWQEYKTVKKVWLYTLKAHTLDTLKTLQNNISDSKKTIDKQYKDIESLSEKLNASNSNLNTLKEEKDSINLFGASMKKGSYKTIMWSIIVILILIVAYLVYKFKDNVNVTKAAKNKLQELEVEFEDHRRIALEREQKVRRQLQDEINKNKA